MHTDGDIPTLEPDKVTAGDTWKWKRSLDHYSAADGWVLTYKLINASGDIDITASADGSDHLVSESAATTAAYAAGKYRWQGYVTKGAERYAIGRGEIEVLPDLATETTYDDRTHARKVLDAIEAVIEGRASQDQMSYSINNRQLSRMPIEDLLKFRGVYRAEVQAEMNKEKIALGRPVKTKLVVRL